jgi:hypothetical protein
LDNRQRRLLWIFADWLIGGKAFLGALAAGDGCKFVAKRFSRTMTNFDNGSRDRRHRPRRSEHVLDAMVFFDSSPKAMILLELYGGKE